MNKRSITINSEDNYITIVYKPSEFVNETCEKSVNNQLNLLYEALANCLLDYKILNGSNELSTKISLFQKELQHKIKIIEKNREDNKTVKFH